MAEQPVQAATSNTPLPYTKPESPEDSPLGVYAPFPYSSEPFVTDMSSDAKSALLQLDGICTRTDVAARRMEVEQAWEALHFDRGYQHLLRGRQGGWTLPGQASGFGPQSQQNNNSIYDTNVYGAKGDIITAALSREVPKVEFFPANPSYGPDITAAEEADKFKEIWARNNNLHELLVKCARIFWNEDRAVLWTYYELDGQKYGFEDDDTSAPTVPQNEENPPSDEPTGQEGLEQEQSLEKSVVDSAMDVQAGEIGENNPEESGQVALQVSTARKPLGREVTRAFGKLDVKVPISVDNIRDMQFLQLYQDLDVAVVKAIFPWISDKIKTGGDGVSEVELDRIARENVRQAVLGAYVTGDSMQRHTVVKWTWLRPSMFMDENVSDSVRAELFEKFPDGCLMAKAGAEFAFARNEKMDDHLTVGHPFPGMGQNRRSLGNSLISIQKRINDWVDLLDDFFKRTVPKKWMNAEAFDIEAIKTQTNVPGSTGPFQPQPGLTAQDQYMMVEPTPQPQTSMPDFIKWFITTLSEEISGALPSLFGAATGEQTVGNAEIQRDSALQRVGCPWNNIQDMFSDAARQAVKCAAESREGKSVSQLIPGRGLVSVNTANLSGNVLCFAESNPSFPESWAQKEAKMMTMIDTASSNPGLQAWIFSPQNLPLLQTAVRMKDFKVPGASSVAKQKSEFELLLRSGPMPNPMLAQAQQAMEQAQQGMMGAAAQGQQPPPEAAGMLQQLQQAMQSMPKSVSTVPVAQDESELHEVEAAECFDWLNSAEGQKFHYGTPQQKQGYENVHLHWQEHVAMAKKIAAANAPPGKPPSESFSADISKMPTPVAIQMLGKMGVAATPQDFDQHKQDDLNLAVQKKAIPQALKESPAPPQNGARQLRR